jgi:hypothetical protein
MSASAATMFGLMERSGLGRYVIGRGGKQTRIEFNSDAEERIKAAQELGKKAPLPAASHDGAPRSEAEADAPIPEPQVRPTAAQDEERLWMTRAQQARLAEQRYRNSLAHAAARGTDDTDAGFEVYRRPGLEIKVRPTAENIARGIRFLKMLEPEAEPTPDASDQQKPMAT